MSGHVGNPGLPDGQPVITYGPNENCTLAICPADWSVVSYQPSLAANGVFIALFSIALIVHAIQGIQLRTWGYMSCMFLGCIDEILGYAGRIMLYSNPFSFSGFLIEIICITTAPVFYCAAIYVTLSRTIRFLDPSLSRFNPSFLYWTFIPFDLVSLALQAGGGATSSNTVGADQTGVNVSLAGLSLQVITLFIFMCLAIDYIVRYTRTPSHPPLSRRMKIFLYSQMVAILLIFARCAYRIDELSEGYTSALFHNQSMFIGLEGVLISVAVFVLCVGNPAYVLGSGKQHQHGSSGLESRDTERGKEASGDETTGSSQP